MIAISILTELEDEQKWQSQFASTTDTQWDKIAQMVREEIAAGEISPLTDVFPPQSQS